MEASTHLEDIRDLVGGNKGLQKQIRSRYDLVQISRKGVTKRALLALCDKTSLSIKEMAQYLPVTERTIQRHRDADRFKPQVSEKILEIAGLYAKGFEVFENAENFKTWMKTPNISLGGLRPLDLLDTTFGIDMILNELGRMEHGVLA